MQVASEASAPVRAAAEHIRATMETFREQGAAKTDARATA
jgi:hypothetical protein